MFAFQVMVRALVATYTIVYVDELLDGGKDEVKHNQNVLQFLTKLAEMGMHINQAKIQVGLKHVVYFSFDVFLGCFSLRSYVSS